MWLAGVDGCGGGWIAAFVRPSGGGGTRAVFPRLADGLAGARAAATVGTPRGALPPENGAAGDAATPGGTWVYVTALGGFGAHRCLRVITARPRASWMPAGTGYRSGR